MGVLLSGMCTMGFLVAAMFFLRFWQKTRDMLFVAFASAFLLFALNQFLLGVSVFSREDQSLLYLPRVFAFGLLIGAIILKNLAKDPVRDP